MLVGFAEIFVPGKVPGSCLEEQQTFSHQKHGLFFSSHQTDKINSFSEAELRHSNSRETVKKLVKEQ